jgi:formate dehydrogenase maturation protein FdhE
MRRDFLSRSLRARVLAERRPEAREALLFYAEIAAFQHEVDPEAPLVSLSKLAALVGTLGPDPLRAAAREMDEESCRRALGDAGSERSFFARVLFQAASRPPRGSDPRGCPHCGHPPQVGCLRPQGDGTALTLVCSLCFREWPASRDGCSGCGGAVALHEAAELAQLRVRTCDGCRRYLHIVRVDVEPEAIPEVDEIAALSLDVWARDRGYVKIFPNLVGI